MVAINQTVLVKIIESDIGLSIIKGQLHYSNELAGIKQIKFIEEHREKIILEILTLTNKEVYRFKSFTTGKYGKHKKDGINMQFEDVINCDNFFTIFNVDRTKPRTTKNGKKGDVFKGKKFIVTKNYNFYKMWKQTGLKIPSLSDFSRYMGNLKPLLFVAQLNHDEYENKLQASTLTSLNISHLDLLELVNKSSITNQYAVNNESISSVNKENAVNTDSSALEHNSTACEKNCENKLIRKKKISKTLSEVIKPIVNEHTIQQSNEEWLADYNNTSIVDS